MKILPILLFSIGLSCTAFAALDDGLVLYYPCDDAPAATVADQSGKGNNATVYGHPSLTIGKIGNAYVFDGSNDYLRAAASASLDVGTQLTCSVWFKAFSYGVQRPLMEWCAPLAGYGRDYGAHVWANVHGGDWTGTGANLNLDGGGVANSARIISVADPSLNEWHHLVVSYAQSSGTAVLYLDGELRATRNLGVFKAGTTNHFYVSRRPSVSTAFWHGLIDDIRVYNRVLSVAEVQELYTLEPEEQPWLTQIGFSDAPDGDQDVTQFYQDETLYVRVSDVDLVAGDTVQVVLMPASKASSKHDLVLQPDGFFTGAIPLSKCRLGTVRVKVMGSNSAGTRLLKSTQLTILQPR